MRLVVHLDQLMKEMGSKSLSSFANATGISDSTIRKILNNGSDWSLHRKHIQKLLFLAIEHGLEADLFEVCQHPLWDSFGHGSVTIFRQDADWDSKAEFEARTFLRKLPVSGRITTKAKANREKLTDLLKTHNCLFVGSPKANPLTEIALGVISGAEPFDVSPDNRKKMPLQHLGRSKHHRDHRTAVVCHDSSFTGLVLRGPHKRETMLKAKFWSEREFPTTRAAEQPDSAAVVIARKPLGTENDVTTILVCGYTGTATLQALRALIVDELPVSLEQLESEPFVTLGYSFSFDKKALRKRMNPNDLRQPKTQSGRWHSLKDSKD